LIVLLSKDEEKRVAELEALREVIPPDSFYDLKIGKGSMRKKQDDEVNARKSIRERKKPVFKSNGFVRRK
jgi:hypothetical protein